MPQAPLSTQELIEADRIERDAVILKGGGLRRILLVSGLNFELRSEDEQNIALGGYQNFLNGLDFPVQIMIHSRKINIDSYIEGLGTTQASEENPLLAELIGDYRAFIASLVAQNPIMEKKFFVVVPYDPYFADAGIALMRTISSLFGKKKPSADAAEQGESLDAAFVKLDEYTEQAISGLAQIGLRAVPLMKDELAELFYNLCNPETIERRMSA